MIEVGNVWNEHKIDWSKSSIDNSELEVLKSLKWVD